MGPGGAGISVVERGRVGKEGGAKGGVEGGLARLGTRECVESGDRCMCAGRGVR